MNTTDPNENPDLVALHRALLDNDCTVKEKGDQAIEYSYPCMGQNSSLGEAFKEAAKKLVPESGGEITIRITSVIKGGFIAEFPDDEKCMAFLIAFSKATEKLYTPSKPDGIAIAVTSEGMVLGAGAKPRRGVYG